MTQKLVHPMNDLISLSRRRFLTRGTSGVGVAALASLFADSGLSAAAGAVRGALNPSGTPHFVPAAKRVIYLFQSGGPSQMDLFDYKPAMQRRFNQELPDRVRKGQRITTLRRCFVFNSMGRAVPGSANSCHTPLRSLIKFVS